ncbi:hypothetical protein B0H67DRAFT_498404 [Lasiosphaeris hirsuta]|uniref:Uncharacterized protein n=1 Tax=Lasiosphaeris hirsuta TaxID=260670 RepID=A0AA39ZWG6_9PEZI|nr:hypothetical protein B0H67DRAFT_498404 [Lasiosphaeris hirsuta]
MSPPDKKKAKQGDDPDNRPEKNRRLPTTGLGSPSRSSRASAASSTASPRMAHTHTLAPPPRAALSGTSSPAPDDRRNQDRSGLGPGLGGGGIAGSSDSTPSNSSVASAVAAAAASQALKEKDERILELERELEVMENAFNEFMDQQSHKESSSYWEGQYQDLRRELFEAEKELRLLRTDLELRDEERNDMRAERNDLQASWDATRREMRSREGEIRDLKRQIHDLKKWVSESTRSDGQAQLSDELFGGEMARLGNGLQNWVLVHLRRAKIDFSRTDESTLSDLGRLIPSFEELALTAKVHMIQSIVARLLMDLVFDQYFVGLPPDQANQLAQLEAFLASMSLSPEPVNQWRSQTLTVVKNAAPEKLEKEAARVTESIITGVNAVLSAITDTTPTVARDAGLRPLVTGAIELARLLHVQKAVFSVVMPEIMAHQRVVFDGATMEDVGGGGDDDDYGEDVDMDVLVREVCCVTFPGIEKRGDGSGGQLQYRNVIAKARVLCRSDD